MTEYDEFGGDSYNTFLEIKITIQFNEQYFFKWCYNIINRKKI